LQSAASFSVEESNQIVLNISDITSSNTYATLNPGGTFSTVSANNLFQVVGNQVVANKVFRKEDQTQYTFDLIYTHGGTQHVENVTVDLTRFLQSQGTFTADESNMVILSSGEFEHLFSFTNDNPGGIYSLTGADASQFVLNDSGDVVSRNALDYDTQQTYNFNVSYTMPDGRVFNSQIQLGLEDTLSSIATLQCEEAKIVVADGSLLTSLQSHATKDANQGRFELLQQGDYNKFTMGPDGTLTSKGELRMSVNPVLDVYIKYHGVGVDDLVEHVQISLTPTTYDHSRSNFISKESGEVVIIPQLNPFMQAYAAADNYAGRWEIAQSPYATEIDTAFFEVADNTGQLKTTQMIDFESGKTDFEVILYYHHSSNTKKYTDFLNLNIINDKRDDDNLALSEIDISTREGAASAAIHLQNVIERINSSQAKLGAIENRFNHNVDNLSMAILNAGEASGRILDADYALESTRLARSQILDQAATDMLVRANQAKQNLFMLINN
jgi:flagellin-like hook-associated protein FlgL